MSTPQESRFALSRRRFVGAASAAVAAVGMAKAGFSESILPPGSAPGDDPILRWVDPRIGTGGHGHCYPGASVPFGGVQLSPDTFNEGWDWCSGYHVSDTSIMGFSHTHLSGTGAADLLDFLVVPGTGEVKLQPGTRKDPDTGYRQRFRHETERVSPGYYSVMLEKDMIQAELTATDRTGLHRYTFTKPGPAWILVDLYHAQMSKGISLVASAVLGPSGPDADAFMGGHVTNAWGDHRHSYFHLQASRKPESIAYYSDDVVGGPPQPLSGKNLKAVLHFDVKANETILLKVGISGVSAEGAQRNAAKEIPAWDFDGVRKAAEDRWRAQIGKLSLKGGTDRQRRILSTALYHMSLGPTRFDDVDGQYRGMDNEVHTLPAGTENYTTFSLWDTFRAAHPAYILFEPERAPQFMNTLIRMAQESPAGMAVWPLWGRETECMTGYHSAAVLAEAMNKGVTGVDYKVALELCKKGRADDLKGLKSFYETGYIPADQEQESVSQSFEYGYDAWARANIAHRLGDTAEAAKQLEASRNYRHFWDPSVGFMRPKLADGSWASPFTPIMMGHKPHWRDYTESNAWQTTFGVQHDVAGLIETLGGREAFLARLDQLFTVPSDLPPDAPPDIAGMVGQYAHGNEPSHHIAYLYVYAGAPWKTQARVRSLLDTMYADQPDGMQGNEDVGQMSAWYLLSALGFYPVDPVGGIYVLGSPLFSEATVQMGPGRSLTVNRLGDPAHPYIQSVKLNGKPFDRCWFRHSEIAHGATLELTMGAEPNLTLGSTPESLPPSLELSPPRAADAPPIRVSGGVMVGHAIKRVQPRTQPQTNPPSPGTVVVRLIVGVDGSVESATIVSGPKALQAAAIEAARQWLFKPFLQDGEPVRVDTMLTFLHGFGQHA